MTILISCEAISKAHGSVALFQKISFSLFSGERIGVVGPNGAGKSTFLKILAGLEKSDTGTVSVRRSTNIVYIPQESSFPDLSVLDIVIEALGDAGTLSIYEKEIQATIVLSKVGFEDLDQLASTLSGGWKKRLEIAKALALTPDIVLFDEPTNHLDLEGILWLEKFLLNTSFTYMIVSHDRFFLENIADRMIELNKAFPSGLFNSNGSFSTFLEAKELFLSGQEQYQRALNSKVRREIDWLRQSPKARTTKSSARIQQAHRLMEELSDVKARNKKETAGINFVGSERETRKLLAATNLSKSYGDKTLFSEVNITLSPGTRLGIVGMNGTGKTTLLQMLAGRIAPDKGTIKPAEDLKIVYFDQHREQLPATLSLRRALAPVNDTINYRGQQIHINSWCRRFLFSPDRLDMSIGHLSGGERARILIARLMLQPADVLLLDEPTNDLDIPTLEVLEESLEDFPGALVLITHDRYMLDQLSNVILGLGVDAKPEFFADYLQWETHQKNLSRTTTEKTQQSGKQKSVAAVPSKSKGLSYHEKREWEGMEAAVLAVEIEIEKQQKLIDNPTLSSDAVHLQEVCKSLQDAHDKLDRLYKRWQELESK